MISDYTIQACFVKVLCHFHNLAESKFVLICIRTYDEV